MNLQTQKPRARWLPGGDPITNQMWEVSHPMTTVSMWAAHPRDAAAELLRLYVLPRHVELMREAG